MNKKKPAKNKTVTAKVSRIIKDRLKQRAKLSRISQSSIINSILEKHL